MNANQLDAARRSRIREIRIREFISEIIIYIIFIVLLFFITYTNIGNSAYDYQRIVKNNFGTNEVTIKRVEIFYFSLKF